MSDPSPALEEHVPRALDGDEHALEAIVRGLQDPIYGLCFRMLGPTEDARDACQEIMIRVITRLSSFRGDSRLTTWAYRIAANYLIDVKRRPQESLTFEEIDGWLGQPHQEIHASTLAHASPRMLAEETFLGCTLAMLRCLDRDHRLAFILGAILELEGPEAAQILNITPSAFRKRLSRARTRLEAFLGPRCGVVSPEAPCRCSNQVNWNVERQLIDPAHLRMVDGGDREDALAHVRDVQHVIDSIELYRRHPSPTAPDTLLEGLQDLLHSGRLHHFH